WTRRRLELDVSASLFPRAVVDVDELTAVLYRTGLSRVEACYRGEGGSRLILSACGGGGLVWTSARLVDPANGQRHLDLVAVISATPRLAVRVHRRLELGFEAAALARPIRGEQNVIDRFGIETRVHRDRIFALSAAATLAIRLERPGE
ncbi:MAG: hypothetical protein H5U40_06490, partial [Polyangiaceae bacterium]|nr:hypothetical protein [Polyangiaceae bacterium]